VFAFLGSKNDIYFGIEEIYGILSTYVVLHVASKYNTPSSQKGDVFGFFKQICGEEKLGLSHMIPSHVI
jgi:hypothetical protein